MKPDLLLDEPKRIVERIIARLYAHRTISTERGLQFDWDFDELDEVQECVQCIDELTELYVALDAA
jgi:hypothetical protein